MRVAAAGIAFAASVLLTGCGSSSAPPEATALRILAVNDTVGRAVFHLGCAPARGDLPDNLRACAALASDPSLVTAPKPFTCAGSTASWWDLTISGRIGGHRLTHRVSTCWTPQMAMIDRLGLGPWTVLKSHLLPRRYATALPGVPRSFPRGALRVGDQISCDIHGHHLEAGIPVRPGEPDSVGYEGAHIVAVTLDVTRHPDGVLIASCHNGGLRPDAPALR